MKRIVKSKRNKYYVYMNPDENGKSKMFTYDINRYGDYALKLAQLSLKYERKFNDYFIEHDDYVIFYVNTRKYGIKEVIVDKEDAEMLYDFKLSISNDNNAKTFYCKVINGIGLHRVIMDAKQGEVVDHINRNGLDNRKHNLRIVNTSINNKNANVRNDSATRIKGVTKEKDRYIAFWVENGKRRFKRFSCNKYGEEQAFRMAVACRLEAEINNDYVPQECSETIESYIRCNINVENKASNARSE